MRIIPWLGIYSEFNIWLIVKRGWEIPINRGGLQLVGGWPTILKHDGVRQWEGWHPFFMKW